MSHRPAPKSVSTLLDDDPLNQFNVLSLLAQASYAFHNGNEERAALLIGAALLAPKYKGASYLIQGALTLNDVRKKL